jgi:hypothetical protein
MINHWLLDAVVEFGIPLAHLFPEVSQALNVKAVPGSTSEDYAECLLDLFDRQRIAFSSDVPGDQVETHSGISRILERFLAISSDQGNIPYVRRRRLPGMQVAFKLTPLGGNAWERIAKPDWSRYVSASTLATNGDLILSNRDLLFAYMGWYPELRGEEILRESIVWQAHTDFDIVYWKRVPFVLHVSFQVQPAERHWAAGEPSWFRDCWQSIQSWYIKPWDLPDWPSE